MKNRKVQMYLNIFRVDKIRGTIYKKWKNLTLFNKYFLF